MANKFHHEALYRGQGAIAEFARWRITVCGVGAVGSNLADSMARQGFRHLRLIDQDRVEEHNISAQVYDECDVGGWKVDVLRNRIFRAVGVEVEIFNKQLTDRTVAKFLKNSDLVVDAFDNYASRLLVQNYCRAESLDCLHIGLSADYGEVVWDERYVVPTDVGQDVCDYPLARNLVLLTVAVASEVVLRRVVTGDKIDRSITLQDFSICEWAV